jgi:antitoxin HicB
MNTNIDYYSKLNYPIEIINIPDKEGGGYSACIPQLGRNVFLSDGETLNEALKNLDQIKKEWFEYYLQKGIPIPEPATETEEEYSGKFIVRVPKELHRIIASKAKQNNISLNQYIQFLLTSSMVSDGYEKVIENCSNKFNKVIDDMKNVYYTYEGNSMNTQYEISNDNIYELSKYLKVI